MTRFNVHWGNRLEDLAANMFERLYAVPSDRPLTPCAVVVNSAAIKAWLRHFFVFEWPGGRRRVLANCSFERLYPFVNNWMDRLLAETPSSGGAAARREPRRHPYAVPALQWRLYRLLSEMPPEAAPRFAPLRVYLGTAPGARRIFQLAGKLATLFDDYQVYRCDMLERWEAGAEPDDWQAELWRLLARKNPASYAALFRAIREAGDDRVRARFDNALRAVAIFATTSMPSAYVAFLQSTLARVVDVDLYVLNPCRDNWLDAVTHRIAERAREKLLLEDHPLKDDPLAIPEIGHPLLCSLGRSLQEHLHSLEDHIGGVSDERFTPAPGATLLAALQRRILAFDPASPSVPMPADDSIGIHICHSAIREVEVLRDRLLRWFTEEGLQPGQIQALVPDLDIYAPCIDAIFATCKTDTGVAIPYAIDGRMTPSSNSILGAFQTLLSLPSSRFAATAIVNFIGNGAVSAAFGLDETDREAISRFVERAAIRWGIDASHRERITGAPMEPHTSWEFGIDRLLAGYAFGEPAPDTPPWPVESLDASEARTLGTLARLARELKRFRLKLLERARPIGEWQSLLTDMMAVFLTADNATYPDIGRIHAAIGELAIFAGHAGLESAPIPFDVVAAHLQNTLASATDSDSLLGNAVTFCQLRSMNARPSEAVCVLGLNDGVFPRDDRRPTFDRLAQTRGRGDSSVRLDDRCAFLETILNARRHLHLSYTGRDAQSNAVIPPSVVIHELRDELMQYGGLTEQTSPDGGALLPIETIHRLHGAHPDYFQPAGPLFSYARDNRQAAQSLSLRALDIGAPPPPVPVEPSPSPDARSKPDIDALVRFFRNPAEHYFRHTLGVRLTIDETGPVSDDEPMRSSSLDRYVLIESLIERLMAGGDEAAVIDREAALERAKADGLLPLGCAGEREYEALTETLSTLMSGSLRAFGIEATVGELVRAQRSAQPSVQRLSLPDGGELAGQFRVFPVRGRDVQLFFRPGDIKAKDSVSAWLRHLFACATHREALRTVAVGKRDAQGAVAVCLFQPVPRDEAVARLVDLLALFSAGSGALLPFAPATSETYAQTCLASDPPDRDRALRACERIWRGSDRQRGENADPWLYHAFGADGPASGAYRARFIETAHRVFDSLYESVQSEAPESNAEESE